MIIITIVWLYHSIGHRPLPNVSLRFFNVVLVSCSAANSDLITPSSAWPSSRLFS